MVAWEDIPVAPRRAKYDWEVLFDGEVHHLSFEITPATFNVSAATAAKKLGLDPALLRVAKLSEVTTVGGEIFPPGWLVAYKRQ